MLTHNLSQNQYLIGSNYAPAVQGAEFILLNVFSLCGGEDFHLLENTTPRGN